MRFQNPTCHPRSKGLMDHHFGWVSSINRIDAVMKQQDPSTCARDLPRPCPSSGGVVTIPKHRKPLPDPLLDTQRSEDSSSVLKFCTAVCGEVVGTGRGDYCDEVDSCGGEWWERSPEGAKTGCPTLQCAWALRAALRARL